MSEVDFSEFADFDPQTIDKGGAPKPGKAMCLVTHISDEGDYIKYTGEIVAHEHKSEVGKSEYNILNKGGKGAKRAIIFALATGLITRQDLVEAKERGSTIDIPWSKAYSKVYCCTLVKSSYQGKERCRTEWDYVAVDSPEAKDYPKNEEYVGGDNQPVAASATIPDDDVPF